MVSRIEITQYRKLKDLTLTLSKKLNAISGTNGTCKTSLLHLIGNALQAPTAKSNWINEKKCLPIIKAVNGVTNPKVESLTRGDQAYNDPAHGLKGPLFTVDYFNATSLDFRRHNSSQMTRYALKPKYQSGTKDTLPCCPVIYLGLSRLVPFGEFQNDEAVHSIQKKLPQQYRDDIARLYKSFTNYDITFNATTQMGDIKVRSEFSSNLEGIDSNTISAGEDNLSIILTALISLKYYYESIESKRDVESVLLIDELDATLHPAYQIKFLKNVSDICLPVDLIIFCTVCCSVFTAHKHLTLFIGVKAADDIQKSGLTASALSGYRNKLTNVKVEIYTRKTHTDGIFTSIVFRYFFQFNGVRQILSSLSWRINQAIFQVIIALYRSHV